MTKTKSLVLALVLATTGTFTACSSSWLSTFEGYLQVAGPILIQILDIVSLAQGKTPPPELIAKINSDQAALNTLAKSVNNASAQNAVGLCAQFNLGVQTFVGDLSAIEQLAQLNNPAKQAEINILISIAQQAIAEVEIPIKACQAAPSSSVALARLQGATFSKSPEEVVKKFNSVVDNKHKVHIHNKLFRTVSLGKLQ